ncbi:hypothetical protein BLN97_24180 [Bradyrhizobium elkanii]|nr:hypothetical protein BLN97_24180 [Bradyrhizobium elkanii]
MVQTLFALLTSQRAVDATIAETPKRSDDGAIEQEDMAAFDLVLDLFNHAVADRRAGAAERHLRSGRG